jgi:DNA-damage-inducible protein J
MAADAVVRARVSESTKREASAILEAAGLTTSDLIRMVLIRVVEDKALPFDPVRPNKVTVKAIEAARASKVKSAKSAKELMKTLNAGA